MSRSLSRVEARHLPAILLPLQRRTARDPRPDAQPARRSATSTQVLRRHLEAGVRHPTSAELRYGYRRCVIE